MQSKFIYPSCYHYRFMGFGIGSGSAPGFFGRGFGSPGNKGFGIGLGSAPGVGSPGNCLFGLGLDNGVRID
jgi:hypothetical protein